ncbi:MAG: hypothetical protein EA425_14375 [Puniceicoccaceae bacterium]|nr:MAG: hypothetical protein EA425_14375 [Puniceicoccaceae bacterium]
MARMDSTPEARFGRAYRAALAGRAALPWAEFMELALYGAGVGYYRADRRRVGRERGTDFFTAVSLKKVFRPLLEEAVKGMLRGVAPGEVAWVEAGAEPEGGIYREGEGPWREVHLLQRGEAPPAEERPLVLFANEVLDAQPFHRLVRRGGRWVELGVGANEAGYAWVELDDWTPPVAAMENRLPGTAPEAYVLDLPLGAEALVRTWLREDWRGLVVWFDYGLNWSVLAEDRPEGTGRAYRGHRLESDLLAAPGEQDLTCQVCWDWIREVLAAGGFVDATLESQEGFFVRRALPAIAGLVEAAGPLAPERRQLQELLHPGGMGQKFQVLTGWRG